MDYRFARPRFAQRRIEAQSMFAAMPCTPVRMWDLRRANSMRENEISNRRSRDSSPVSKIT